MGELVEEKDGRGSASPCVIVMLEGDGQDIGKEGGEFCKGGDGKGIGGFCKVGEEDER